MPFWDTVGKIGEDLLPAIPVVGNVISSAIQRGQSRRDIERQNEYNSPKNQLARLREAGLPAATMLGGSYVNAQTDLPQVSNLDPTLGTAKGIETFMQNRIQKQQIQTMRQEMDLRDATIQKTRAEADVATGFAEWMKLKDNDVSDNSGKTNAARKYSAELKTGVATAAIKDLEVGLKGIEYEVSSKSAEDRISTIAAKLTNILVSNDRLRQIIDLDKARQTVTESLNEYLKGDQANGFMAWISALLLKMMK